jgi:DNA-binding NarL/FixJ family response regulator
MASIRILVADDHSIVRRGVRALLESQAGWKICGEAATGAEAILKAKRLKPDVIVMDISMPELNGLEATRQIHAVMPETLVLILSMHESDQHVREMLDAGARGYILKSDLDQNLYVALQTLLEGKKFFSPKVSEIVVDGFLKGAAKQRQQAKQPSPTLTPRQREVVRLLAEGKSNKEIGVILGISTKTVEAHRAQIMHRLELDSFSDLVLYAARENIVEI